MNKKILITGASGGIGRAIARELAGENVSLLLHYMDPEKKAGLEKELGKTKDMVFLSADLLDNKETADMMNRALEDGVIDVVIHCVSLPISRAGAADKEWSDFQAHLDMQVKSLHAIIKKVMPGMKEKKKGKIINILTEYTTGKPPASMADYVTAKYALLGFSKCLAAEYGKYNITCNCISPGITETDLTSKVPGKLKEIIASQTPLGRICTKDDVAGVVGFLCSDKSDFINGENIVINGGYSMR